MLKVDRRIIGAVYLICSYKAAGLDNEAIERRIADKPSEDKPFYIASYLKTLNLDEREAAAKRLSS